MNTQTFLFSFSIMAALAGLVWLAMAGSVIAVVILSVITTIMVFVAGGLLNIQTVRVMNERG